MYEVMVIENDVEIGNETRPPLATWSETFPSAEARTAYVVACVASVQQLGWPAYLSFVFNEDFGVIDETAAPTTILEIWP